MWWVGGGPGGSLCADWWQMAPGPQRGSGTRLKTSWLLSTEVLRAQGRTSPMASTWEWGPVSRNGLGWERKLGPLCVSPVKDKEDTQVDSEARPMKDETFGEYR